MDARALQLSAYAAAIDALRATSNPGSPQVIKLLRQLRHTFKVSEQRHAAEVRRACADERLNALAEVTPAAWLRRARRPCASSDTPIGVRNEERKRLADELVKQLTGSKDTPTVNLNIRNEEIEQRLSPSPVQQQEKKKTPEAEHVIRLPRGTVITVGEEKQEASKPGRKRKGDMVIKSVKMVDTPKKRPRRKPPRFQQSPDKHIVKNAIRAAKTKVEVKIEKETEEVVVKTNGVKEPEKKPKPATVMTTPVATTPYLVKPGSLKVNAQVTTATPVLIKPTVYTVTQPVQAVHIVSNAPKTSVAPSVASFSSFGMADILNKESAPSSSRPSSAAPPAAPTTPSSSTAGSVHATPSPAPPPSVTPTKPPNIDVTPATNSTKPFPTQQSPLTPQSPSQLHRKSNQFYPAATPPVVPENTQELQRRILSGSGNTKSTYIDVVRPTRPAKLDRAPTPAVVPTQKSYVMSAGRQNPPGVTPPKQSPQTSLRKPVTGGRVHQTVTSLSGAVPTYQRTAAATSPAYVLPPSSFVTPLDLGGHQRQLIRGPAGGSFLVGDQTLLTPTNPHIISTGLPRVTGPGVTGASTPHGRGPLLQPLLLHPYAPGSLITHPQGAPQSLQLNGAQPGIGYSSIELARLQQQSNNNR